MGLFDKTILMMGASSGIAAAAARLFAAQGAHLAIGARDGDRLGALVHETRSQPGEAIALPGDV